MILKRVECGTESELVAVAEVPRQIRGGDESDAAEFVGWECDAVDGVRRKDPSVVDALERTMRVVVFD